MEQSEPGPITVVHVDDEPDLADMASLWLERKLDDCEIKTATSTQEGLEYIDDSTDCVISDYDMPRTNGLEFLEQVRERYSELPFILFTGKGSEEIASEAISRGVTDYIQKESTTDIYTLLANRIENAVNAYRAEQAARETRKRYNTLIEQASDIIFVVDPNGEFIYLSPAVKHVLGYDPEELTGEIGFEYIHPDDQTAAVEEFARVVENPDEIVSTEFRTAHKDGSWVPLEIRGRNLMDDQHVGGIVVIGRDITDRKERDLELIETVVEGTTDALFASDPDTGGLVYLNETTCELLGRSREELLGTAVWDVQTTFSGETDWDDHVAELRSTDSARYEDELRRTDGSTVSVEINATLTSTGETEYVINAARDVGHSLEAERELQQRVDRLDELVSVISHDLRNPLRVASGHLELAREQHGATEDIEAAADAIDRGQHLLDDLLELVQEYKTTNQFQPVTLTDVIEECWAIVGVPNATLRVETDLTVRADPDRLKRVFENLLRNAVDHAGEAPVITVGELNDRPGFYVADDGPGIPFEEREAVFEAGYSTDPDGSGLGLSIVRTIVDAHEWTVSVVESRHGGTRFEITGVDSVDPN